MSEPAGPRSTEDIIAARAVAIAKPVSSPNDLKPMEVTSHKLYYLSRILFCFAVAGAAASSLVKLKIIPVPNEWVDVVLGGGLVVSAGIGVLGWYFNRSYNQSLPGPMEENETRVPWRAGRVAEAQSTTNRDLAESRADAHYEVITSDQAVQEMLSANQQQAKQQATADPRRGEPLRMVDPTAPSRMGSEGEVVPTAQLAVSCVSKSFTFSIPGEEVSVKLSALLDGHGEAGCMLHVQDELASALKKRLKEFATAGLTDVAVVNALRLALVDSSRSYGGEHEAAANVAIQIGDVLWVANVGDTRAVLVSTKRGVPLSIDSARDKHLGGIATSISPIADVQKFDLSELEEDERAVLVQTPSAINKHNAVRRVGELAGRQIAEPGQIPSVLARATLGKDPVFASAILVTEY